MTRSVAEWVADHDDQAIPPRVRLRIWEREQGRCYLTGRKIRPGDTFEYEHKIALSLGGEHRESNIFLALSAPHKKKTAEDRAKKAKSDSIRKKHLGIKSSKRMIPYRRFNGEPVNPNQRGSHD